MADKVQRYEFDASMCEGGGNNCGASIEEKSQGEYVLYADYAKLESLHASIIDQGRKVLNATSEIGMSHAEFIEWALERLEGK